MPSLSKSPAIKSAERRTELEMTKPEKFHHRFPEDRDVCTRGGGKVKFAIRVEITCCERTWKHRQSGPTLKDGRGCGLRNLKERPLKRLPGAG